MTRRIWVVLAAAWFFACGLYAHAATAGGSRPPSAHYELKATVNGMPTVLVLRNCSPEEDSYAKPLHTKVFEPNERLVLRCQTP